MASINNYAKVAAGEIIESNPEAMRMTRDFLAMRREGRQNFIASVLSGGKIGGFGRVTEANMAGPDMSRLSDLEKRKDAMLKDAQKARMDAIKALAEGDDGVRSLAEELIKAEGSQRAANAAASASRFNTLVDRERGLLEDMQKEKDSGGGMFAAAYEQLTSPEAGNTRANQIYREVMSISPGSPLEPAAKQAVIDKALGPGSELLPGEQAVIRSLMAGNNNFAGLKIPPPSSEAEAVLFQAGTAAVELPKILKAKQDIVDEVGATIKKARVGTLTTAQQFAVADDQPTLNIRRNLELLGQSEELRKLLDDAAKNPVLPQQKEELDDIDNEMAQIKSATGGVLRNEAKAYMRTNREMEERIKSTVERAYEKQIDLAGDDAEKKTELEAQRDELLAKAEGVSGRRFQRALLQQQREIQRGQRQAFDVTDTGEIERIRSRNIAATPTDKARATAVAGMAKRGEDVDALTKSKTLTADLGVGQGARPVMGAPQKPAADAAAAPPKAPTGDEEKGDDEEEEDVMPGDAVGSLWQNMQSNPFDTGRARSDLLRSRLAALQARRDGSVT
jgi:hypothetical protein